MILWLWRKLWGGCEHHWETVRASYLVETPNSIPHGIKYTQKCTKCGKLKSKEI